MYVKTKVVIKRDFFIACTEFLCFISLNRMFAEGEDGFIMTPSNVDQNGAYLIDRSPTYFEPILNYLRNGQLIFDNSVNPEGKLYARVLCTFVMLYFICCFPFCNHGYTFFSSS